MIMISLSLLRIIHSFYSHNIQTDKTFDLLNLCNWICGITRSNDDVAITRKNRREKRGEINHDRKTLTQSEKDPGKTGYNETHFIMKMKMFVMAAANILQKVDCCVKCISWGSFFLCVLLLSHIFPCVTITCARPLLQNTEGNTSNNRAHVKPWNCLQLLTYNNITYSHDSSTKSTNVFNGIVLTVFTFQWKNQEVKQLNNIRANRSPPIVIILNCFNKTSVTAHDECLGQASIPMKFGIAANWPLAVSFKKNDPHSEHMDTGLKTLIEDSSKEVGQHLLTLNLSKRSYASSFDTLQTPL